MLTRVQLRQAPLLQFASRIQNVRWNSDATKKSTRLKSTPHNYIILGAKSSKLLPRRIRPKPTKPQVDSIKVDVLEEQRKQLLVFKSESNPKLVSESINQMRPLSEVVSSRRYNQISLDIMRSFSVSQLREFVSKNSSKTGVSRANKTVLCDTILKDIWNLQVSQDINESSDVIIEKTIQLSKRDLFIILSRNGAIPRSWTKAGARIVIVAQEFKIVVRSTADTFDWILASLHKTLQSIKTAKIGLSGIAKITDVDKIPLARIQQLSNVALEMNPTKNTIYASGLSYSFIDHARRLIVQSTGFKPRVTDTFIYDTNDLSNKTYAYLLDDDAMNWSDRSKSWCRIQNIKRRQVDTDATPIVSDSGRLLQQYPSTNYLNDKQIVSTDSALSKTVSKQLYDNVKIDKDSTLPLTFTATFGYLLHESNPIKSVKELLTKTSTTFATNIPKVSQKCSGLPLNGLDVFHEESAVDAATNELEQDDLWKQLLEKEQNELPASIPPSISLSESPKPKKSKLVDTEDDFVYLAQLKFVPAPTSLDEKYQGSEDFQSLPPIELWLEIDDDGKCDLGSARLVAVEEETNTFLSLPDKPADIKFSSSCAKFLDHEEQSVQSYLNNSSLDFSGATPLHVPDFLTATINGKPTRYLYQSMLNRRQVDLKYKNNILQLSTIEGGGFEGRRLEASMVLDYTEGMSEFNQQDLERMVENSLELDASL